MTLLHGIDLTEVSRMEEAIRRQGRTFTRRIFSAGEERYCESKSERRKYEHYAARFAAKEAVKKALGLGPKMKLSMREIEVRRYPSGKPFIYLAPRVWRRLKLGRNARIELSLTHETKLAMAAVLIMLR